MIPEKSDFRVWPVVRHVPRPSLFHSLPQDAARGTDLVAAAAAPLLAICYLYKHS